MAEILYHHKKIFYRKSGSGPVVVLLHGFGETGEVWNRQVEELQKHHTLIIPDLPGSGNSYRLDDGAGIDDYADSINTIMNQEAGGAKFHLFGHSMGGYTTMAFVEKFSDRLQTFGLVHSSAFADTKEKVEIRQKGIEFIRDHGGQKFLKSLATNLFSEESLEKNPELVNELVVQARDIDDSTLIQYYQAMIHRPDRSGLLSSAHVPVFFLIGKYDPVVPYDVALKQCHLPDISSVTVLEHSGHLGIWEEADIATDSMVNFLNNFGLPK